MHTNFPSEITKGKIPFHKKYSFELKAFALIIAVGVFLKLFIAIAAYYETLIY